MYRKEVHFYRELAERCPVPHAECYYADLDEESDDFILLLADLAGGRTVDQLDGCALVDAELAVDRLAGLHACFWNDPALVGKEWLGRLSDPPFPAAVAFAFDQSWGPVQDLFGDRMTDPILALGNRFSALLPALTARLSEDPCTLSHGDYRLDNMFFGSAGELAVYDWQLVDRSRGARDLAYFLTQSLAPEARAEAEEALIERYVAQLDAHGIEGYGLEAAWEDYRLATLLGFAYPVIAGGGLDHADERATQLTRAILDRSIAAITHLDCLGLIV